MLSQKVRFPFQWTHSIPSCKCTTASLSAHLLMDTGCFQIFAIVNNAAMNLGGHIFFEISVSGFFGYIPRNGIGGSKGSSIFNFFDETPY